MCHHQTFWLKILFHFIIILFSTKVNIYSLQSLCTQFLEYYSTKFVFLVQLDYGALKIPPNKNTIPCMDAITLTKPLPPRSRRMRPGASKTSRTVWRLVKHRFTT